MVQLGVELLEVEDYGLVLRFQPLDHDVGQVFAAFGEKSDDL